MVALLNIDLGELPDEPEEFYTLTDIANIACGGHAGDEASMTQALERCQRLGTRPGAHPSYPDRENFGRTAMAMTGDELRASVRGQCAELRRIAERVGVTAILYAKAHGALYHAANKDPEVARALVAGVTDALGKVRFLGPAGGAFEDAVHLAGSAIYREGFADRAMRPDGSLVPRTAPGALLTDPAAASKQALSLLRSLKVDTICVHGDTPGALEIARAVAAARDAYLDEKST